MFGKEKPSPEKCQTGKIELMICLHVKIKRNLIHVYLPCRMAKIKMDHIVVSNEHTIDRIELYACMCVCLTCELFFCFLNANIQNPYILVRYTNQISVDTIDGGCDGEEKRQFSSIYFTIVVIIIRQHDKTVSLFVRLTLFSGFLFEN